MKSRLRKFIAAILAVLMPLSGGAWAASATFSNNGDFLTGADLLAVSPVDGNTFNIGGNDTLLIELDDPFATNNNDDLFTLYYDHSNNRNRDFGINFGFVQNGQLVRQLAAPQFFSVRGTGSISLIGFGNFCSVAGGCTFLEITNSGRRGGFELDAVAVNGQVVSANTTAPTPEPQVWALMMLGFSGLGWRLKQLRRRDLAATAGPHSLQGLPA